jgi:hypothetical protein
MTINSLGLPNGVTFGNESLTDYDEGTFVVTATGLTTSPTLTVYYTRVGKLVSLTVPSIGGTSNSAGFSIDGLPAALRPARQNLVSISVTDNGVVQTTPGMLEIQNANNMNIYKNFAAANFTASGGKSLVYSFCVTYQLT